MKTVQELDAWRAGAAQQFGDPAIPVCQLFVRWAGEDFPRPRLLELFCSHRRAGYYILRLGREWQLRVPLRISSGRPKMKAGELKTFGAERITHGMWALQPSLNLPGLLHGFVVLYEVPDPPPWAPIKKDVAIYGHGTKKGQGAARSSTSPEGKPKVKTSRAVTAEQVRRMRQLLGQGLSYGQIAQRLVLSYSAVERHLRSPESKQIDNSHPNSHRGKRAKAR